MPGIVLGVPCTIGDNQIKSPAHIKLIIIMTLTVYFVPGTVSNSIPKTQFILTYC